MISGKSIAASTFPMIDTTKKIDDMTKRKTTEQFILDARLVHGNKYLYTKVVYINKRTKVCITCPEHGDFWQTPENHLQGCGCYRCGLNSISNHNKGAKTSLNNFKDKIRIIHGKNIDTSLISEYKGVSYNVTVRCNSCGNIWVTKAASLLHGYGCPECKKRKMALSQNEFLIRLKKKFGDLYDYSKIDYTNKKTPVTIICKRHGELKKEPMYLLSCKIPCPKCREEFLKNKNRQDFFIGAKKVHGDKYDYSKVDYVDNITKVSIICKTHGVFLQSPREHIAGCGCSECAKENMSVRFRLSTQDFITKSISIHGNKYDYSLVEYINNSTYVKIKCKKCQNVFLQIPMSHLKGHGCPHCKKSLGEERIALFLQKNNIDFLSQHSIQCGDVNSPVNRFVVDYFIPSDNTIIEFNGGQHYKEIKWFGGKDRFILQVKRDEALREYCKHNNLKLIEIPFWDYDNIELLLYEKIKKNKILWT